jgi:hypothetical protein
MTSTERQDRLAATNRPTLSIIIVNWNTRDLLAQCLESVRRDVQTFKRSNVRTCKRASVETFVVDNASTDGSAQMVRERFPWVRLIENEENVGFARANNQAIRQSRGRYVLLLNPDTEVQPGALETLVRFMDDHPQAGAAGVRLLNPDGTLQRSTYLLPTLSREFWRLFHLDALWPYSCYRINDWDLSLPRQVDIVQGACLAVRREALERIGLLDEEFFIYSEEVDLCYRLLRDGWSIYWVPQAKVVHYEGQSTRQVAPQMFLYLYRGKVLFFRKHYGPFMARAYKMVLVAVSLSRIVLGSLAYAFRMSRHEYWRYKADLYRKLLVTLPAM